MFGVLTLQRHRSPLSGSIWSFNYFFSLIFFLLSLFSLVFLSYHCFTYIFLISILLVLIFFTFQHSPGYFWKFWLVSVVHSTSLVAFSFSNYFRVLRTGILQGLGLFLRFWISGWFCAHKNLPAFGDGHRHASLALPPPPWLIGNSKAWRPRYTLPKEEWKTDFRGTRWGDFGSVAPYRKCWSTYSINQRLCGKLRVKEGGGKRRTTRQEAYNWVGTVE